LRHLPLVVSPENWTTSGSRHPKKIKTDPSQRNNIKCAFHSRIEMQHFFS
jgi:hypothetical protein